MSQLAVGDVVTFLADGFAIPLRGKVQELDEDTVSIELLEAALDEDGNLRPAGITFRVARFVVAKGR